MPPPITDHAPSGGWSGRDSGEGLSVAFGWRELGVREDLRGKKHFLESVGSDSGIFERTFQVGGQ